PVCAETSPLPATITLGKALPRRDSPVLAQMGRSAACSVIKQFVAGAHERVHLGQCGRGCRGGPGIAVAEHLAQESLVGRELGAPGPEWAEGLVDGFGDDSLECGRPARADLRCDLGRV